MKGLIIIFVLICSLFLIDLSSAEIIFHCAVISKNVKLFKMAQRLNPFVSDYAYEEYRLTGDVDTLLHAIALEPTKAAYHMYYGLALLQRHPRTLSSDQGAVKEICKAARLKPYSPVYRLACEKYKTAIQIPEDISEAKSNK